MNSYNKTYLDQISQEKGFVRDNLEKVIRLAEILRYINQSPLLQKSLVLKSYSNCEKVSKLPVRK